MDIGRLCGKQVETAWMHKGMSGIME